MLGKNANPLEAGAEDEEMLPRPKLPFIDRLSGSAVRHTEQEIDCLADDESQ